MRDAPPQIEEDQDCHDRVQSARKDYIFPWAAPDPATALSLTIGDQIVHYGRVGQRARVAQRLG
jgi:hypothetical protein